MESRPLWRPQTPLIDTRPSGFGITGLILRNLAISETTRQVKRETTPRTVQVLFPARRMPPRARFSYDLMLDKTPTAVISWNQS